MSRHVSVASVVSMFGSLLFTLPSVASAQTSGTSAIKGFVSVNAGVARPSVESFSDVALDTDGLNRDEVRADYKIKKSSSLDIAGGAILGPGFLVGLAVSHSASEQPADLTLTLTHPQFHPTLTATIQTGALNHTETGVHLEFGYALPTTGRMDVLLFGGPSHFSISQRMIIDFFADELFNPATNRFSAVVSDPVTERKTGSAWGYHVGTDVSFRVMRLIGIGALVRYSKATVSLADPFQSVLRDQTVTQDLDAGGWQVAGGVRLRF